MGGIDERKGKDYAVVKAKLLGEFRKRSNLEEELQKSISASLDPREISVSLGQLEYLNRRVGFNDTASFNILHKAVTEHQ